MMTKFTNIKCTILSKLIKRIIHNNLKYLKKQNNIE